METGDALYPETEGEGLGEPGGREGGREGGGVGVFLGGPALDQECREFAFELIQIALSLSI